MAPPRMSDANEARLGRIEQVQGQMLGLLQTIAETTAHLLALATKPPSSELADAIRGMEAAINGLRQDVRALPQAVVDAVDATDTAAFPVPPGQERGRG